MGVERGYGLFSDLVRSLPSGHQTLWHGRSMLSTTCLTATRSLVCVVDDDESVRESLPDLLRSFGMDVQSFASAATFLASDAMERTGCLILDVSMPEISGPELQQELSRRKRSIPIVFITAHAEERTRLAVIRRGAIAYLTKPFSETTIVEAVQAALARA